jgi:hypothetical protein
MRYFVKYLNKDAAGSLKAFMQPAGELKEKFHEKEKDMDRSDYRGCKSLSDEFCDCPGGRILAGRPTDCRGISGCYRGVHRNGFI